MSKAITEKGKQKILGMARNRPYEKTIAHLYPDFANAAIRCVDIEEIRPKQLSPSSPLRIEWQCPCGNTSVFKMIKMVKERKSVLCYDCKITENKIRGIQKGRATTKKIKEWFPNIAKQFIAFVDYPEFSVDSVSVSSKYNIKWKCTCDKVFVAKLFNKNLSNFESTDYLKCPDCTRKNIRINNFGKAAMPSTVLFKDAFPIVYKQMIRLADPYDILPLEKVSTQSGKKAIWKCNCGIEFKRQISIVSDSKQAVCKVCNRNGESLFELEMKELLEATLNLEVVSQHSKESLPKVDLYIPSMDLAIQLDPYYFHKRREESDFNINEKQRTAYDQLIRLREAPLKQFANSIPVTYDIKYIDKWLELILDYLKFDGPRLDITSRSTALLKANETWNLRFQVVKNNLASSEYFPYFVKNLTHPGRKPEYTPIGSGDICVWLCPNNHERCVTVSQMHRKSRKNECSECKKESNLLIERFPDLAKTYIKSLDSDSSDTVKTISASSTKSSLWKCECGYPIISSVAARARIYKNMCYGRHNVINLNDFLAEEEIQEKFPSYIELHNKRTDRATKSALRKERIAVKNVSRTVLAADFRKNLTNPDKPIEELTLGSNDICLWKCKNGHERKTSPKNIFERGKIRTCKLCAISE